MICEEDPPRPSTRFITVANAAAIAAKRTSFPAQLARQLRDELDWIVLKALEKSPSRRYESPLDFAHDIRNYLDDVPVSARPPSRVYVLKKWVRRNRALFGAACAVTLALTLGVAGVFVQWRRAEAARAQAEHDEAAAILATGEAEASAAAARRGVLSRDERFMAGAVNGSLIVVDLEKRTATITGELGKRGGVLAVADHSISGDGQWIATTGFGPRARIFRLDDPRVEVAKLSGGRQCDTCVAFNPRGDRLYVGNEDGTVGVWNAATWTECPELRWTAQQSTVSAIAISNDGALIATAGDSTLKLWRAEPAPGDPRHELLAFKTKSPDNWIHFARDENGRDRALLYSVPNRTIEILEAK